MKNIHRLLTAAFLLCILITGCAPKTQENLHYTDITSRADLRDYFRYSPDKPVLICGHRGGMTVGYPENCIESFEMTLSMMPAFFEIDPRLTRDSVIVLMHDETIDRTTTGTGHVSDYTLEELQQFSLVDRDGNVTPYKIPTLSDCLEWSRGKTVFNLDLKDVPAEVMVDFITGVNPPNVMYIAYSAAEAREYLDLDPDAMISCSMKTMEDLNTYLTAGVPWEQMTAFLGFSMRDDQQELYDILHEHEVMTMVFCSPRRDEFLNEAQLAERYDSVCNRKQKIQQNWQRKYSS